MKSLRVKSQILRKSIQLGLGRQDSPHIPLVLIPEGKGLEVVPLDQKLAQGDRLCYLLGRQGVRVD